MTFTILAGTAMRISDAGVLIFGSMGRAEKRDFGDESVEKFFALSSRSL